MALSPALIHYDAIVMEREDVRTLLAEALRGDRKRFDLATQYTASVVPSMKVFLEAALDYAQCGQQVFCVQPTLQKMLLDTDCHEVPIQFLKLPHRTFYIALPDCPVQIYGGERTGFHQIGGIYVQQHDDLHWMLAIWGLPNAKSIGPDDDATLWAGLDFSKADQSSKGGLRLYDIEGYLQNRVLTNENDSSDVGVDRWDKNLTRLSWTALPLAVRIVVNLVLYLASKTPDTEREPPPKVDTSLEDKLAGLKSDGKKKKLLRKLSKVKPASKATVIWVGKQIEKASESTNVKRDGATWTTRRGHFHHYWTGPRTNPDGTPRVGPHGIPIFGDHLILKWVAPIYRAPGDKRREYHFVEETT